ncbi:hypothetical protein BAE44_0022538, partial [Dichanthelium oligosanthes]
GEVVFHGEAGVRGGGGPGRAVAAVDRPEACAGEGRGGGGGRRLGAVAAGAAGGAHPGHQRDVHHGPARRQVRPLLDPPRVGIVWRAHVYAAVARLRAQV